MSKSEDAFLATTIIISTVGLLCNALSFSFFIKRRTELGNVLLVYMNIVDMIVSLAVYVYIIAPAVKDKYIAMMLTTVAGHTFRCAMLLTGLLTIYLNVLRTAAIIWPMVIFKRGLVLLSLAAFATVFIGVEVAIAAFYKYPILVYRYKKTIGQEVAPPFSQNHPFVQFTYWELQIIGIPIICLVIVCCLVSATKLLLPNKSLDETEECGARANAAITVLILGVQYVVWNAIGLTFWTVWAYHRLHGGRTEKYLRNLIFWGNTSLIMNSSINPIVYICRVKKLREHIASIAKCHCLRKINSVAERHMSRTIRETSLWNSAAPSPSPVLRSLDSRMCMDSKSQISLHSNSRICLELNSQFSSHLNSRICLDPKLQNCSDSNSRVCIDSNPQTSLDSSSQNCLDSNSRVCSDSNPQISLDSSSQICSDSNSQICSNST